MTVANHTQADLIEVIKRLTPRRAAEQAAAPKAPLALSCVSRNPIQKPCWRRCTGDWM